MGASIEPCGAHPGRTARAHLRALAGLDRVQAVVLAYEHGIVVPGQRPIR